MKGRLLALYCRLRWLALRSQTSAVRFWFGLASLGFSWFFFTFNSLTHPSAGYAIMYSLADVRVWAIGFGVHGAALIYGSMTRTYSNLQLILEGVLGVTVWGASGLALAFAQGTMSATVAGAFVALWLLIRYPTHWEYVNAD